LKISLPSKAFKPIVGIDLEFLSSYQENLFIATPFSLKSDGYKMFEGKKKGKGMDTGKSTDML